jgi:hypothetical protein
MVLLAMLVTIVVMLLRPRRFGLAAFLFSTFLIPAGQEILVGGVHLFVYRIIVLAGLVGLALAKHSQQLNSIARGWNSIDTAFLLAVSSHVVAFCLLYQDTASLVNQTGFVWDYLGGYFLLRRLIQNEKDINKAINYFAYLAVALAICMVHEQVTGRNIFGLLNGVRLVSQIRDGQIRSEGVFQHAILAGTFGATLLPLFVWLWKSRTARILAVAGIISSAVMTLAAASSTPLMAYGAGILGMCFWPLRKQLRFFRWGLVISLVALHLAMKAPVWALIERVDMFSGSSGYHRFQLVDQFIRHLGDWWLLGTKSNAYWGSEMIDTSNTFVEWGTAGGLTALISLIVLITRCFGRIGTARKALEVQDRRKAWLLWFLGAALFSHVVAFFGIFYFDQTRVAWFALLAMISAATAIRVVGPAKDYSVGPTVQISAAVSVGQWLTSGAERNE